MTEFEKALEPVENWVKEKLKGRLPYSEEIDITSCAALILQYEREQCNIADVIVPKGTLSCNNCYWHTQNNHVPCGKCKELSEHKQLNAL